MNTHGSDMLSHSMEEGPKNLGMGHKAVEILSSEVLSSIDELASPYENVGLGCMIKERVKWSLSRLTNSAASIAGRNHVLCEICGVEISPRLPTASPEAPLCRDCRARLEDGLENSDEAIGSDVFGLPRVAMKEPAVKTADSPFALDPLQTPYGNLRTRFPKSALQRFVPGMSPLIKRYRSLPPTDSPADFASHVLEALEISVRVEGELIEAWPRSGPLILAANHPFGGLDGLVVAALCARARPDLKILANQELCRIAELRPLIIPVDVFGVKDKAANVGGLRSAIRHVESGGALAVFPAGVVSHWHSKLRRVIDPEWNPLIGRLTLTPGAAVIPLFFEGCNSLLFQAAGCLHPALRTSLLPHEMWRMRKRGVTLRVGKPVEGKLLSAFHDDKARTAHLRARCYGLGRANGVSERYWPVPVAAMTRSSSLMEEIGRLQLSRVLVEEEKFQVLHLAGCEHPSVMREIGRLREKTFRAASEGSGKELDLDRYDPHYSHLVLWDKKSSVVAGGYRAYPFSPCDPPQSDKTLYTASLFNFQPDFFRRCGVSMELGRAFVTQENQRDYAPLMMLWKGIGRLAALFGVRTVFGPSSISLTYTPESILMLRQHLLERHFDWALSVKVQGRCVPGIFHGLNAPDVRGFEYKTLDRAVKDLEGGVGLPILFKHYLQLGGRIAAFNEDRQFGTVDALMVVDLAAVPDKLLKRYTGDDGLVMLRKAHLAAGAARN